MHSVIRNYFNFEVVSLEINGEAKNQGYDFGIANVFTNEKCRMRWSYLHLQRKLGKAISYKRSPYQSASESETNKENVNKKSNQMPTIQPGDGSRLSQLIKPKANKTEQIQKSAPKEGNQKN